jgi:hypothetical protein
MVYARLAPEPSTGGVICGEESANAVGEITVQAAGVVPAVADLLAGRHFPAHRG